MIAQVQPWILGVGAALLALLGLWWWRRPAPEQRLEADARDPTRRWVQNTFMLVTGDCDYAHLSGAEARRVLAHWWDVYGPLEHRRTLVQLASEGGRDHAWHLLRFILVSRLGVAAGYYHDVVSWSEILPVARRLQAAYPSWRAMAQAYAQARRQAEGLPIDGSQDDAAMQQIMDNLAHLDDTRWAALPFDTPLHAEESEADDG